MYETLFEKDKEKVRETLALRLEKDGNLASDYLRQHRATEVDVVVACMSSPERMVNGVARKFQNAALKVRVCRPFRLSAHTTMYAPAPSAPSIVTKTVWRSCPKRSFTY